MKKPKRARGRPRIEINFEELERLAKIYCTEEEAAAYMGVSVDTLARRVKEKYRQSFPEFMEGKQAVTKAALRRKQISKALEGNIPLLIFLGKNYLGQSDKAETQIHNTQPVLQISQDEAEV